MNTLDLSSVRFSATALAEIRQWSKAFGPTYPDHVDLELLSDFLESECPELHHIATQASQVIDEFGYVYLQSFDFVDHDRDPTTLELQLLAFVGVLGSVVPPDDKHRLWAVSERADRSTFSVNRGFAEAHIDAVTMNPLPEKIGLFGITQAKSGGETFLIRIDKILSQLAKTQEGDRCLAFLRTALVPYRRPTVFTPEGDVVSCVPILGNRLRWRSDMFAFDARPNLRNDGLLWALNFFAAAVRDANHDVSVVIEPFSILIWTQEKFLHGRTAFSGPRLLLRFWLHDERSSFEQRMHRPTKVDRHD